MEGEDHLEADIGYIPSKLFTVVCPRESLEDGSIVVTTGNILEECVGLI